MFVPSFEKVRRWACIDVANLLEFPEIPIAEIPRGTRDTENEEFAAGPTQGGAIERSGDLQFIVVLDAAAQPTARNVEDIGDIPAIDADQAVVIRLYPAG